MENIEAYLFVFDYNWIYLKLHFACLNRAQAYKSDHIIVRFFDGKTCYGINKNLIFLVQTLWQFLVVTIYKEPFQ